MENKIAAKTEMIFSNKNGRVITDRAYYEGNARISAPMPTTEFSPYYFLITMGGGFVEGEEYEVMVEVRDNAGAVLTSQAPTYVFRSLDHETTKQNIQLKVGHHATLEFLMDDLLPYKDAIFKQKTTIQLQEDSNLIYLDGVTSGWSPEDQPFQYESIRLDTKILMDGRLVVSDHFISEPHEYEDVNHLGLFEHYTNYNTLLVVNPDIDDEYIESMRDVLDQLEVQATYGISKLEVPGFAMRILGETMDDNKALIFECANKVRQDLFGEPAYELRKNDYEGAIR